MNPALKRIEDTEKQFGISFQELRDLGINPGFVHCHADTIVDLNAFLMLSWLKRELISEFKKVKEHTVKEIKEIHFDLHTISFAEQEALGFDKNKEYHRFWEWPYCRCPRLDNEDIIGLPGKYHSMDCPVHGWLFPYCRCPKLDNEDLIGLPGKYHSMDCPMHGE